MVRTNRNLLFTSWAVVLLSAFFTWFYIFNRYHLWNLEQNQLFRFDAGYLTGFFEQPGGLITLAGSFFTQFFHIHWLAALILTCAALWLLLITSRIILSYNPDMLIISALPVILLASVHNNHNFRFSYALGWIITISSFFIYTRITNTRIRYVSGIAMFVALYLVSGFFAFLLVPVIFIDELIQKKQKQRFWFLILLLTISLCLPVLLSRTVFLISYEDSRTLPMNEIYLSTSKSHLIILSISFPVLMLVSTLKIKSRTVFNIIAIPAILVAAIVLISSSYERRNELFIKMDHSYRKGKLHQVLLQAEKYPANNRLVIYYTNLALARQGLLSEKMFHYRQSGSNGLWLDWSRNETAPLYGGEFFHAVGYLNESFRWAFEAMEINDMNPRVLDRLITVSLVNNETDLADKYINYLENTLFYRNHAQNLKAGAAEFLENRNKMLIRQDFISTGNHQYELMKLLENQPLNRIAYEYLMASFLLDRNLEMFSSQLYRLKELGYDKIPVHFEEALILYQGITNRNLIPAGYTMSQTTQKRFHDYAATFASYRYSKDKATLLLGKKFGNTFWYYMQFGRTTKTGYGK